MARFHYTYTLYATGLNGAPRKENTKLATSFSDCSHSHRNSMDLTRSFFCDVLCVTLWKNRIMCFRALRPLDVYMGTIVVNSLCSTEHSSSTTCSFRCTFLSCSPYFRRTLSRSPISGERRHRVQQQFLYVADASTLIINKPVSRNRTIDHSNVLPTYE